MLGRILNYSQWQNFKTMDVEGIYKYIGFDRLAVINTIQEFLSWPSFPLTQKWPSVLRNSWWSGENVPVKRPQYLGAVRQIKKIVLKYQCSFHFTQTCQDCLISLWLGEKRKIRFVFLQPYGFHVSVEDDLHRNVLYFWNVLKIQNVQDGYTVKL